MKETALYNMVYYFTYTFFQFKNLSSENDTKVVEQLRHILSLKFRCKSGKKGYCSQLSCMGDKNIQSELKLEN